MRAGLRWAVLAAALGPLIGACSPQFIEGTGRVSGFISAVTCPSSTPWVDAGAFDGGVLLRRQACTDLSVTERREACDIDFGLRAFRYTRRRGTIEILMHRDFEAIYGVDRISLFVGSESRLEDGAVIPVGGDRLASANVTVRRQGRQPINATNFEGTLSVDRVSPGLLEGDGRLAGSLELSLGTARSCDQVPEDTQPHASLRIDFDFDGAETTGGRPGPQQLTRGGTDDVN